jgi:ABC-type sulfate/molybdate transport systems ATPase subunit
MLDAHIVKRRRDLTVEVHLKIEKGGSFGLFGASGAGKSTILSSIAGIEQPDDGSIRFGGIQLFPPPLPLHLRPVGYLTQEPHLFPHLTVARNIAFGLGRGLTENENGWLADLRASLRLEDVWNAPAARISGGQARRVALARMLARRPSLVLLDEPFAGLDRQLTRELIEGLLAWKNNLGFTMIVVDHQAHVLEKLSRQVAVIERGQVIQQGDWEQVRATPATDLLRKLLAPL